jgi:hypothetical protein
VVKLVLAASVPAPPLEVFAGAVTSTSCPLEKGLPAVKVRPPDAPLGSAGLITVVCDTGLAAEAQ